MKYSTADYVHDLLFMRSGKVAKSRGLPRKLKEAARKTSDFDYLTYIDRIIGNIPFAILIVYLGALLSFVIFKATESGSGIYTSVITTNSMTPAIKPGSMLVTFPYEDLSKGDIISFREVNFQTGKKTGRVISHRIEEVRSDGTLITKGDFIGYPDPGFVKRENVLGKIKYIFPYLGYFYLLIRTIPGFILFVLLPALLLIKNELKFLKAEKFLVKGV